MGSAHDQIPYDDPTTRPFWEGTLRHELLIQRCDSCGGHQFYPRPFCLACGASDPRWVQASGGGVIYSLTEPHIQVGPQFVPPYVVAIVELDEGPRMLTHIEGGPCAIGDRVQVVWRAREGAPPLPIFQPVAQAAGRDT